MAFPRSWIRAALSLGLSDDVCEAIVLIIRLVAYMNNRMRDGLGDDSLDIPTIWRRWPLLSIYSRAGKVYAMIALPNCSWRTF